MHFLHRKIALKKFSPASQQRTWKDQTYPRKQLGQPRLGTFFSRFQPCFRLRCTSMSLISRSRNTTRLKWTAYIHVMSKEPLIFTIWLHGGCRTKRSGSVNFTLHLQHGQATAKYVCWEKVSRALAGAWFLPWDIESPKPKKVARSARSARSKFLYQIHPKDVKTFWNALAWGWHPFPRILKPSKLHTHKRAAWDRVQNEAKWQRDNRKRNEYDMFV